MDSILVVNAGSSSVKFQVFGIGGSSELTQLIKGEVDGIGARPRLRAAGAGGGSLIDQTYTVEDVPNVATAMSTAGAWLRETQKLSPVAVGHRVVHGGPEYGRPILINDEVVAKLERYI